jgi:hypothetical protein
MGEMIREKEKEFKSEREMTEGESERGKRGRLSV